MSSIKKKKLSTVVGLSLDGHRLEAVLARRTNGSIALQKVCTASLALDPLTNEPELVGREIRNQLDVAGIREKDCVVGLPSEWAFSTQVKLPEIPEEDIQSLLNIEAERSFPYGPESLIIATSRQRSSSGEQQATLAAVQLEHLTRLESVLKFARLKPQVYALNISALALRPVRSDSGIMTLSIGKVIALQVSAGSGVPSLRILEGAIEAEPGQSKIRTEVISREIRITLGQLSPEIRSSIRSLQIFGDPEMASGLAQNLRGSLGSMGIQVEAVKKFDSQDFGVQLPPEAPASAALSLAARYLADRPPAFEFVVPKVSQWQQLTARYASKKLVPIGAAAACIALLILLGFGIQQYQLSKLRTRWAAMSGKVSELENLQQQIRKYRPWFDDSLKSLSILRRMTEAFPEEGSVTAKTVEIHNLASVSCSGSARDSQALLRTLDRLRAISEIHDVNVDQMRGKSPIEFMFNFHWGEREGGSDGR